MRGNKYRVLRYLIFLLFRFCRYFKGENEEPDGNTFGAANGQNKIKRLPDRACLNL